MEELKRCPFCGGEAVIRHGMISDDNIYMECVECDSCLGIFHEEGAAIAAWNRRVEGMSNPADICRECEVRQSVKELEEENMSLRKAGHRLAMLMCDIVLDKKIDEQAMSYAIAQWSKAREKEESK